MSECVTDGTLTICFSRQVLIKGEPAGPLWCFGCRKRLPHDWQLWGDAEPSYYDPAWRRTCSGCGKDRTWFPGCEGTYGDDS